jgi:hypothetical protein
MPLLASIDVAAVVLAVVAAVMLFVFRFGIATTLGLSALASLGLAFLR